MKYYLNSKFNLKYYNLNEIEYISSQNLIKLNSDHCWNVLKCKIWKNKNVIFFNSSIVLIILIFFGCKFGNTL